MRQHNLWCVYVCSIWRGNNPDERSSHLLHGEGLKSLTLHKEFSRDSETLSAVDVLFEQ